MTDKLCKDCKWCRPFLWVFYEFAECAAPRAQAPDGQLLVDGSPNQTISCAAHRGGGGFDNYCGRQGRWWEAKVVK